MTHEASFEAIAARLVAEPGITDGTGFGSSPGLRVDGRIFAMLVHRGLVVKLPASRCARLVTEGTARPFDRGQGRPLKEWVVINDGADADWPTFAAEALAFVGRRPPAKPMPAS